MQTNKQVKYEQFVLAHLDVADVFYIPWSALFEMHNMLCLCGLWALTEDHIVLQSCQPRATIRGTDSPDRVGEWKKHSLVWWIWFLTPIFCIGWGMQMVGQNSVSTAWNPTGHDVWDRFFFGTFGSLFLISMNPDQSWLEYHSLSKYRCWPCASLHGHILPSPNGFLQHDNAACHKA